MPYIVQSDRHLFEPALKELKAVVDQRGLSNGELNYLMTMLGLIYTHKHGVSYNILSDVIKAYECAKLEFYRRKVAPYEDLCIARNGDVYFDDGPTIKKQKAKSA